MAECKSVNRGSMIEDYTKILIPVMGKEASVDQVLDIATQFADKILDLQRQRQEKETERFLLERTRGMVKSEKATIYETGRRIKEVEEYIDDAKTNWGKEISKTRWTWRKKALQKELDHELMNQDRCLSVLKRQKKESEDRLVHFQAELKTMETPE